MLRAFTAPFPRRRRCSAVEEILKYCTTSVAVVHFVAGSKTGIYSPSVALVSKLEQKYGERLVVSRGRRPGGERGGGEPSVRSPCLIHH